MDAAAAHAILFENLDYDPGKFYSNAENLPVGVGSIFSAVRLPLYDTETALYYTSAETGYILSHECDIDPANDRPFSEFVLICPILPLEEWIPTYLEDHNEADLKSLLAHIGKRNVSRVFYLPPLPPSLQFGGLMYLNQITHAHVSALTSESTKRIASVTEYGLQKLDHMIQNHLLRPKAVRLALGQW
ncbi:MAG TPA: hypothetical protein VJQ47_10685 [Steroidobacteraceae bacterium]|nr:hypothetical protein [Steroidobacteraceae bacterium]